MFDRVIVAVPRRSETHYHTTTEKRAPTDESVRLLREMEAEANARVLDAIRVGNTDFECVVHAIRDAPSGDTLLRAVFSIGGKKMTADARDWQVGVRDLVEPLIDEIARKIAAEIVRPVMRGLAAQLSVKTY